MGRNVTIQNNVIDIKKYRDNENKFVVRSKNILFTNEYIKVDVFYNKIVISVPTLDCVAKLYKPSICNDTVKEKWYLIGIVNDKIKEGVFEIDTEESTEDSIVIYFDQTF